MDLVNEMLVLNDHLVKLGDKQTEERKKLEDKIYFIDKELNELVYKIYGITEEETKIIEESLKWKILSLETVKVFTRSYRAREFFYYLFLCLCF